MPFLKIIRINMGKGLKKELGLLDIFCIASGAMISSGLFILPGIASVKAGPALFVSYLIASVMVLPAMFSKAELTTAMPKSGGDYFFITRTMGLAVGTIAGMSSWFSLSLKSAFALIGMGAYASLIMNMPLQVVAVLCCLFFMMLNLMGTKHASHLQIFLVMGLIAMLLIYVIKGFGHVDVHRYVPFLPNGAGPIFATAGFVFISYGGLTKIASMAGEIKNPGRNIPLGMILSLAIVGLIYALVIFVTTGLLEPVVLRGSLTPISTAAYVSMGRPGMIITAVAALLAFFSTANAGIMSASRYPMAMSRDKILPSFLQKLNLKFKTPHYSIFFTCAFMIFAILFLNLETLVKVASILLILLYISANVSVIIMRESKIQNYQPIFRSPLYPWMQIAGILGGIFLIITMGRIPIVISALFIMGALLWFRIYVHVKVKREFALIHVIERITAKDKELTSNYLSTELRQILRERDEIIEDRFDYLIKKAQILDAEGQITVEEFFKRAASTLTKTLDMKAEEIYSSLIRREMESSTVIRGGLAIPHIIIEGERKFSVLLARCKQGIKFPGVTSGVKIVFVLAGSKDERNFHLRALAAIAEIAQQKDFDKKWMSARNTRELRDIVLLAERKRVGMPSK